MNIIMSLIQIAVELGRTWYASNESDRAAIEAEAKTKLEELAAMRVKYQTAHDERTAETEKAIADATAGTGLIP